MMGGGGRMAAGPFFPASPWQMLRRVQEDMDQLFGQVVSGVAEPMLETVQQMSAAMDVSETDREIRLDIDLPGVPADEMEVRVEDSQLLIRAEISPPEREETAEGAGRRYYRRERTYGVFQQVISLPDNVDENQITSEFRNGVLTIHLPKTERERQQGRRIPVQAEAQQGAGTHGRQGESRQGEGRQGGEAPATGTAGATGAP